jgi:hypothetical protein
MAQVALAPHSTLQTVSPGPACARATAGTDTAAKVRAASTALVDSLIIFSLFGVVVYLFRDAFSK